MRAYVILLLIVVAASRLQAGSNSSISKFSIGEKKFVIFKNIDIDDNGFKIDTEVAGYWDPEIGEAIRYYNNIRTFFDTVGSDKIIDTLDICKKVQVQGSFDTTGAKRIYFQFIFDPKDKIKEWQNKWFWHKEGVKQFSVLFDTETLTISSINFQYGTVKKSHEQKSRGKEKGKI